MQHEIGSSAILAEMGVACPSASESVSAAVSRRSVSASAQQMFLAVSEFFVLVAVSVGTGLWYRETAQQPVVSLRALCAIGIAAVIFFCAAMHMFDTARGARAPLGYSAVKDITISWIGSIFFVASFAFSVSPKSASWDAMLAFAAAGFFASLGTRAVAPRLFAVLFPLARDSSDTALIIGVADTAALGEVAAKLTQAGDPVPYVVGLDADCSREEWNAQLPVNMGQIYSYARMIGHGNIYIVAEGFREDQLEDVAIALQLIPSAVQVVPNRQLSRLLHLPQRNVGEICAIELQKAPMSALQRFLKRGLDLAISTAVFIAIVPLLVAITIAIKLDTSGPVLFRQRRLGFGGRPFAILKFRTMTVLEDGDQIRQAEKGDNRITRIGHWLRKTSCDELPQLINVMKGEMSLVGPRPHAVAHDKFFSQLVEHYEVRQFVKPGITGWAQVNGLRGNTENIDLMRSRVEFDLHYAKNASVWFDVKILFLTAVEVFRARNAL